jgi:hypothetical protein
MTSDVPEDAEIQKVSVEASALLSYAAHQVHAHECSRNRCFHAQVHTTVLTKLVMLRVAHGEGNSSSSWRVAGGRAWHTKQSGVTHYTTMLPVHVICRRFGACTGGGGIGDSNGCRLSMR